MNILLVNPSIFGDPEAMHIGLATVGSFVNKNSHHRAKILDFAYNRKNWKAHLRKTIKRFEPGIIGIYASHPLYPCVKNISDEIKNVSPDLLILDGGQHPTLVPEDVISHKSIDTLIIGEGEKPTVKLLDALEDKASLGDVPGLWWKDGNGINRVKKGFLINLKDILPIDWDLYERDVLEKVFCFWGSIPMMASRGCPARCSYCAITEIQCDKYGALGLRFVHFYDLNFLINEEWLKGLRTNISAAA